MTFLHDIIKKASIASCRCTNRRYKETILVCFSCVMRLKKLRNLYVPVVIKTLSFANISFDDTSVLFSGQDIDLNESCCLRRIFQWYC